MWNTTPKTPPNTKKPRILRSTVPIPGAFGSAILVITVRAIIPRISSMSAAPIIAFPALDESLPSSLSVSTVMLTDVAVSITPMNMFWRNVLVGRVVSPLLKK